LIAGPSGHTFLLTLRIICIRDRKLARIRNIIVDGMREEAVRTRRVVKEVVENRNIGVVDVK
jgi:hypothetical protein